MRFVHSLFSLSENQKCHIDYPVSYPLVQVTNANWVICTGDKWVVCSITPHRFDVTLD